MFAMTKAFSYDPWRHQKIIFQIAIIETGDMPQKVLFDPF
jgi:hypothetical protein